MADQANPGRIDIHHHFYAPEYREVMESYAQMPQVRDWTLQRTLEEMDQNNVDTALLSLSPPGIHRGTDAQCRALARAVNENAAALRAERPTRFGHFATVPMPDVDATLAEIAYAQDTLGADGIQLMTSYGDRWPGHPDFDSVFDELNRRKAVVFIHPLTAAVDPVWECKSDWEIYKGIAKKFSEVAPEVLGVEKDLVLVPILHDSPGELAQPLDVKDWKTGEIDPIPGKTMPQIAVVKRDYPNLYKQFTAVGPLLEKLGNGGKGISWNTEHEVEGLKNLSGRVVADGPTAGMAQMETDIDAAEAILMLAPETNGEVAVKAWEALSEITGLDHTHLARPKEDEKIRFRDVVAQPRKIISSPTWSGIESETVCYNACYTNVHELIPWRTLTGRQQLYQDHLWMRAFGEALCVYRPPIDTKTIKPIIDTKPNGNPQIVLNFITPHQKWGIHSTYTDNLIMLTLSRGGPIVWLSETDAARVGIADNDWIEAYNTNGALSARAVVSQRIKEGTIFMYHAQEKIVNVPGSEITGHRGGIHNSVTRAVVKPTHMIGGYAQLSYGFNYYGTVGSNRDEFVIVRRMDKVDWLDGTPVQKPAPTREAVA